MGDVDANETRFSGFAELYDAQRPAPPARLGPMLQRYAATERATVVDIGSGTGLSTRWAATWASAVIGIEPNDDMRSQAERQGGVTGTATPIRYRRARSDATGLADASADVVLVVQALHWMEPVATLAEIARVLRPGGVLAVIDVDFPPVVPSVAAEAAWQRLNRRVRVFDARVARGEREARLRRAIEPDDADLADDRTHDPHLNRLMADGVRSWPKGQHLANIERSGHFSFTRELLFDEPCPADVDRFIGVMASQGSYQQLRRAGLSDADLGFDRFEAEVREAFAAQPASTLTFCWRVRLGVRPG